MNKIKDEIKNVLESINYPGMSRDIVSFGFLKDIIIDKNILLIVLKLSSENSNHKTEIKKSIITGIIPINLNQNPFMLILIIIPSTCILIEFISWASQPISSFW